MQRSSSLLIHLPTPSCFIFLFLVQVIYSSIAHNFSSLVAQLPVKVIFLGPAGLHPELGALFKITKPSEVLGLVRVEMLSVGTGVHLLDHVLQVLFWCSVFTSFKSPTSPIGSSHWRRIVLLLMINFDIFSSWSRSGIRTEAHRIWLQVLSVAPILHSLLVRKASWETSWSGYKRIVRVCVCW